MNRPTHFEFGCDDPNRAAKFYSSVFGWTITKWEGPIEYWLVMTGEKGTEGINGGLMKREMGMTTVNTIEVADVDEFCRKIEKSGGKTIRPKSSVPGVGWFAYCADTEGNVFGIMENDTKAK